jgi:hypothetical protein
MKLTPTIILETLFSEEVILFEDVVDILKMEITYDTVPTISDPTITNYKIQVFVPSFNKKLLLFIPNDKILKFTSGTKVFEESIRKHIVQNLELEKWLNCNIDITANTKLYFTPEKIGIKDYNMDIDTDTQ